MARIRSLHPKQWTDAKFVSMSPLARLLSLAVRNEADDQGIFIWEPVELKIRLLPLDSVDMAALLSEMELAKQVISYEIEGVHYCKIRNFTKYQKPKSPNSLYPQPPEFPGTSPPISTKGGNGSAEVIEGKEVIEGEGETSEAIASSVVGSAQPEADAPETQNGHAKTTRGTRLPEGWEPLEDDVPKAKGWGLTDDEIRWEHQKFTDYWRSRSGAKGVMLDWDSTWRNWMRKAADDKRNRQQRDRAFSTAKSQPYAAGRRPS